MERLHARVLKMREAIGDMHFAVAHFAICIDHPNPRSLSFAKRDLAQAVNRAVDSGFRWLPTLIEATVAPFQRKAEKCWRERRWPDKRR